MNYGKVSRLFMILLTRFIMIPVDTVLVMKNPGFGPRQPPKAKRQVPGTISLNSSLELKIFIGYTLFIVLLESGTFINFLFDLYTDRCETGFDDRFPQHRGFYGFALVKLNQSYTLFQTETNAFDIFKSLDRAFDIIGSTRSRYTFYDNHSIFPDGGCKRL